MKNAFSLVELSIVLVVLGLLTGGILTGQNLIRSSEMRSVTVELQRFQTAVQSFRNKYFALPGDMPNATDFWGAATSCPGTSATPSTDGTTCSGNGNGLIEATTDNEHFKLWQHLANAGLIEGNYTGVPGTGGANDHDPGINAPASKMSNGVWAATQWEELTGQAGPFNGDYKASLIFGSAGNGEPNAIMTPEELWNIDKKVDDGMPATGLVVVRARAQCAAHPTTGALLTTNSADAAILDAKYPLNLTDISCAGIFRRLW